ncbi:MULTISPECIES: ABC transporter ATP-binding protein [Nocardiopsidaceae]|uniref:ABC transporter ATP-binding protein n=1 Tax=Streptomonospora nanhaiensis TaxID=1323731 RepID=A0ABY6YP26_9ACTN|nr:ABC transporter ATP-binding protein [Streptomonospora nanhaiensis]WAE74147.1 ABC transporter ATP-binding protein [Streptomonospora nanhaiensis]
MRVLPQPPGIPDHRSANRFLLWLARSEWRPLAWAGGVDSAYRLCGVLMSAAVGATLDSGVVEGDPRSLLLWFGVLTGLTLLSTALVPVGVRAMAFNWYSSAYRTVQVVIARSVALGPTLTRRLPSGEVVAVGTDDIDRVGDFYEDSALVPASVVTIGAVSVLMLSSHVTFGLIVLVAVPVMVVGMVPLLRPFSRRQEHHRTRQAELTTRATDLVSGLRVLRGVGGERTVGDRYREESQRVRAAGVRVGWMDAALQAVRELYPGLLLVGIVWYGARLALAGDITVGQLVAFYGYTGNLAVAIRYLMHASSLFISARVAADHVVRVLSLEHDHPDPEHPADPPAAPCDLRDPASGVVVAAGRTTGVVCSDAAGATALAERLGRYREDEGDGADTLLVETATGREVRLRDLPLRDVRRRVLVASNSAHLFSGRLREELSPDEGLSDDRLAAVVRAAYADDVVRQSPAGFDALLTERGREYSGGQQQRLRLARAFGLDPEILVLVEPASAVDAHSEAAIGARLAAERKGRTTALITTSPLLLDHTDHVLFVDGGRVVAEGSHRDLLASAPGYADTVLRTVSTSGKP